MSADSATLSTRSRPHRLSGERIFFTTLAAVTLASVVVGFSPTYYLQPLVPPPPRLTPASPLVHLHAGLFSAWIVLFMVQVSLVAAGRRDLHRALGGVGLALVPAMILVGTWTAFQQVVRRSGPPGLDPLSWLAMPLASVVGFGVLFSAALWLRRAPGAHKRLMVLGMAAMMSAAFGRMLFIPPMLALLVLPNLYVVALGVWDVLAQRRLHPATLWGGLLVLGTTVGPIFFWSTPAWRAVAAWATAAAT